jgi:hypothetical protein
MSAVLQRGGRDHAWTSARRSRRLPGPPSGVGGDAEHLADRINRRRGQARVGA